LTGEKKYLVRELKITDLIPIHKMYDSQSTKSKNFFLTVFIGFERLKFFISHFDVFSSFKWFLGNIFLLLSTNRALRKILLYVYSRVAFFPFCAVNERGEVIAFAYIAGDIKPYCMYGGKRRLLGRLGIFIRDDYQSMGIGYQLISKLLATAYKEKFWKIFLTVDNDNVRANGLYKKWVFMRLKS
jgi:GNAT superfamily N-acetyltransferase